MSAKRKSWQEKLADSKGLPKVCPIDCRKSKHWGTGTFVIRALNRKLIVEGHKVIRKRNRFFVENFERCLAALDPDA